MIEDITIASRLCAVLDVAADDMRGINKTLADFMGRSFMHEQICSEVIYILTLLVIISCFRMNFNLLKSLIFYHQSLNYFLFPSTIEMIVTSGNSSLKKMDSATLNTILLRTDGFKNVFRGLTYKSSKPASTAHSGTYTSIGKRTPAKEYTLTKDSTESRFYQDLDRSGQMRRTQTASVKQRVREGDTREKEFEKADQ